VIILLLAKNINKAVNYLPVRGSRTKHFFENV